MALVLHSATNQAHLEDLQGRLRDHLTVTFPASRSNPGHGGALVHTLADVVRAMDKGSISPEHVGAVFAYFRIPGFSFERWLAEMLEQGVYVDTALERAA